MLKIHVTPDISIDELVQIVLAYKVLYAVPSTETSLGCVWTLEFRSPLDKEKFVNDPHVNSLIV